MEFHEFEEKMKYILHKYAEASDTCTDCYVVSIDPDRICSFGRDYEGNLSLEGASFPLKIKDMTRIRYGCGECFEWDFIRFEFGENVYLDCCIDDCSSFCIYQVKYFDKYERCHGTKATIELINSWINSKN